MIFRRRRKSEAAEAEPEEAVEATADDDNQPDEDSEDTEDAATVTGDPDLAALDVLDWRTEGPWDISEVDDLVGTDLAPKIDLGSLIVTGVPGSELRLQVAEETKEIVSAMLILETEIGRAHV